MTLVDGILDTSIIVRYLTGRPPEAARRARDIIDSDLRLGISDVAIVETAHVLTGVYQKTRAETVDALAALVQRRNIISLGSEKEYVVLGLMMCRPSGRISFGDATIWAAAKSHKVPVVFVYTLDERFPADGFTRRASV